MKNKKSVEQQAIDFVVDYEKKHGRKSEVLSEGSGYDILSKGRKIEVKGVSKKKPSFIIFNQFNFKALQREDNFYLYIVYNIDDQPKLLILNKNEVLKRLKFKFTWDVPLWKDDFK